MTRIRQRHRRLGYRQNSSATGTVDAVKPVVGRSGRAADGAWPEVLARRPGAAGDDLRRRAGKRDDWEKKNAFPFAADEM